MTPDMPVIKGPAERAAEKIMQQRYGPGPHFGAETKQLAACISAEYDSERREMVRVMEGALEFIEPRTGNVGLVNALRAAIERGKKDL